MTSNKKVETHDKEHQELKIRTELLLRSKDFESFQPDFAKVLLPEAAYTKKEAFMILDNFFRKDGN